MLPDQPLQDVTRLIQLSVAPVFLLTGAGTTLSVLTARMARIVDRGRVLERELKAGPSPGAAEELDMLARRARLVHLALTCGAGSALCICLLITTAFVGFLIDAHFAVAIAVLFVLATVAFAGALVLFLREVFLAMGSFRLGVARPKG
jgi:hypothetical protein